MAEIIQIYQLCPAVWLAGLCLLLVYGVLILFLRRGWKRIPLYRSGASDPVTRISVIIPVRNEAGRLPGLFDRLGKQTYPPHLFEVIFVDDHSTDSSFSLLQDWSRLDPARFILSSLPGEINGKKAALEKAISLSSGELIVQADGDIFPGPGWLHAIASFYEKHRPLLVILPVAFEKARGFCSRFFRLEFASLTGVAGGSAGMGHPVMCNGANLAYCSGIFRHGEDLFSRNIPSGDDMMLLQALKKKHPRDIMFMKSHEALVTTPPPEGLKNFFYQRFRWVSKSTRYDDPDIIAVALLTLFTSLFPVFLLGLLFININNIFILLIYILIKSLIDSIILIPVLSFLNFKSLIPGIFFWQWVYPLYIFISAAGGLWGKFRWKNRNFGGSFRS